MKSQGSLCTGLWGSRGQLGGVLLSGTAVSWVDPSPNASLPAQLSAVRPPTNSCESCTCKDVPQDVFFLPHQTFPFFRPSHFLLLSNLLKLFISLSPLCSSPCPDAAYTCFVVLQRKTTQDKRAIKLWDLLSVLLTKLWTHQASEDNEALWIWCLGNLGENSPFMEAFDFISGSLLGSQLLLFHSQQLLPLTSSSDFPVSPMLFACWGQDLFVLTPVGQVCFLPGHMPVVTEFFNPLS